MLRRLVLFVGRGLSVLGAVLALVAVGICSSLIGIAYFPISIVYGLDLLILAIPMFLLGRLFQWLVHDDWFWKLDP